MPRRLAKTAYFRFLKAAFSSSVMADISAQLIKPPAALPLVHDAPPAPPKGNHDMSPAAMWMRPHSAKQMEAIMAAASLTVGAGVMNNERGEERGELRRSG